MDSAASSEVIRGERFDFGQNWASFLKELNDQRIAEAERSLKVLIGSEPLAGKTFVDIGSGSGLFSLAARRLGAKVRSLDFDERCVACAMELKRRYFPGDPNWEIGQGSILDEDLVRSLGKYDIVYSWGVLHHTGDMAGAFRNVRSLVAHGGKLCIAIYNDQGPLSRYWAWEKRLFNSNPIVRRLMVVLHLPIFYGIPVILSALRGKGPGRGMQLWHDYLDWLGGYPFEVARPGRILDIFKDEFELVYLKTVGSGTGCNEYTFEKKS